METETSKGKEIRIPGADHPITVSPADGRVRVTVAGKQGVSIVPACVRNLHSDGVCFYRLQPDDVRVELVAAWK